MLCHHPTTTHNHKPKQSAQQSRRRLTFERYQKPAIKSSRFSAALRGISRMGLLSPFKLAHICIYLTSLHMWNKQGIYRKSLIGNRFHVTYASSFLKSYSNRIWWSEVIKSALFLLEQCPVKWVTENCIPDQHYLTLIENISSRNVQINFTQLHQEPTNIA